VDPTKPGLTTEITESTKKILIIFKARPLDIIRIGDNPGRINLVFLLSQ